jgi:NAD(P)-dependent dehydrogenase (short-subunit alcohol dehydrogenase family)
MDEAGTNGSRSQEAGANGPGTGEANLRGVVISGCSTGIGRTCALRLVRAGYRVFAGVRKPEDGEALRSEAGHGLTPLLLDVTDAVQIAQAARLVETALGANGRLAALVNNAGIAVYGPLELLPIETLRRQFEVNVIGHVAVTQAFVPLLRRDRGRIVVIGSSSGFLTPPFLGPYASSKCALESITDALRRELAPWGIEVCILQPGAVQTPLWDKSIGDGDAWFDGLSAATRKLYAKGFLAMRKTFLDKSARGVSADDLAERVLHVMTAKRPRARYPMGMDTLGYVMLSKLPPKLVDTMLATSLGHTRKDVEGE